MKNRKKLRRAQQRSRTKAAIANRIAAHFLLFNHSVQEATAELPNILITAAE